MISLGSVDKKYEKREKDGSLSLIGKKWRNYHMQYYIKEENWKQILGSVDKKYEKREKDGSLA